ncbi:ATP-dependent helicase [Planctomicrobium sp. SH664]|uniref:ATP-dependent helicase n=1 Tax=Planctomicrobium sp. SH664 TaxID=3448125 RepID=UPI003F5B0E4D
MDDLTPPQRAAVEHLEGPLLILAGPGSGKTRVVTRRIANLLAHGVRQHQILAITFTNKAAGEMAERVGSLVPNSRVWISTFHRFCARLLRQYGEVVGLKSNFSILDTGDQRQALRRVLVDLDYDPAHFAPDKIAWRISNAKNDLITPELYHERFEASVADHLQAVVRRVYPAYQKWLLDSNAVDFDDLLMHAALLLADNPDLREQLDSRYRYVLVDEYQDTNLAQYQIVAALSQTYQNLCVTGDPDQSIYGWRGARIENILRFERDYPQASTIRLEQNFRSTQAILRAADSLIINNRQRKHKELHTDKHEGTPVQLLRFQDSYAEAEGIALQIRQLMNQHQLNWNDFAIFYRVNSLSRQLELAFTRNRIPYQVAAGVAFYDRAEIKDLLAYLRLIENPADESAFLRIVNKPLRGLGKTSQDRLLNWARQQGSTLLEAAAKADKVPKLSKKAVVMFKLFAKMFEELSLAGAGSVADLLTDTVRKSRYTAAWEGLDNEEAREHLANVEELVASARLYDSAAGEERSLQGFLEQTALVSDLDRLDDESGRVTLMTLHAAKGLEFPAAFIVGVEDGLIPHERSQRDESGRECEEERRLLFVGITRAREHLFLTESRIRSMHGRTMPTIMSPFLRELDIEQVEVAMRGDEFAGGWGPTVTPASPAVSTSPETGSSVAAAEEAPFVHPMNVRKPLLTTGASLLSGQGVSVQLPVGFSIGQQVRHPRYGRGTVQEVSGFGKLRTVTVKFPDQDRIETFVAAQAPLQPIG